MTLGNLKNKIYALLSADEKTSLPALCYAIDSAQRKVASLCGGIKRDAEIKFVLGKADAPKDFMRAGENTPRIDFYDGRLMLPSKESKTVKITYYAYPAEITDDTPDTTELELSALAADTVSYGAAGELCSSVRPGDVRRYMEIMTEYDERMAGLYSVGIKNIKPAVFAGRRLK